MTPTLEDSRNPDVHRPALWIEFLLVLAAAWLPLFVVGWMMRGEPRPRTVESEIHGIFANAGIILLLVFLLWRNHESLRHVGIRRTRWWSEILWAILIYVSCWMSWIILGGWASMFFGREPRSHDPPLEPGRLYFILLPAVFLISALFEELLIRGYVWNRLQRLTGSKGMALVGSSILFTAYHPYQPRSLVYVFTFGMIMGLYRWKGRSLPRLILAHTLFNLSITYVNWVRRGG
jgi:membrane protease YdiL (CAAX protease family)